MRCSLLVTQPLGMLYKTLRTGLEGCAARCELTAGKRSGQRRQQPGNANALGETGTVECKC